MNALLQELSERLGSGRLTSVRCVPSSDVSASEAAFHGVPLTTLEEAGGAVDVIVDVADQIDISSLAYIVGRGDNGPQAGQPCLPRLRELLAAARQGVVLAPDEAVCTTRLGGSLPVEIIGDDASWEETAEVLDDIFLGDAEVRRRSLAPDATPRGGDAPVLTPEGNYLIDVQFYEGIKLFGEDVPNERVAEEIESVEGVVAHGLVTAAAVAVVVVAGKEGPVEVRRAGVAP